MNDRIVCFSEPKKNYLVRNFVILFLVSLVFLVHACSDPTIQNDRERREHLDSGSSETKRTSQDTHFDGSQFQDFDLPTENTHERSSADHSSPKSTELFVPRVEGVAGPKALLASVQKRKCPQFPEGKELFSQRPCDEKTSVRACIAKGCLPLNIPQKIAKAPPKFFDDCSKKNVLCVGSQREFKSIKQAAESIDQKATEVTIKIAVGLYHESVRFSSFSGKIIIQGESNDPYQGTRVQAPRDEKGQKNDATFYFKEVKEVVVERLAISGAGHGIFAQDFISVLINNNHLVANTKTGVTLRNQAKGKATITNNIIQRNGAVRSWSKGGSISVLINNNHRIAKLGTRAVLINNNHRGSQYLYSDASSFFQHLDYGIVSVGVGAVDVGQNTIRNNGAGGVQISRNPIAVLINNNHRVPVGGQISVLINNNHRVSLKGNRIAHNGPMGRTGYVRGKDSNDSCSNEGDNREGGFCYPPILKSHNGSMAALGVGAVIAGMSQVHMEGNSFYANDAIGVLIDSAKNVTLLSNAISRNGIRPYASYKDIKRAEFSGVVLWNIIESLTIQRNLVLDHLSDGILVHNGHGKSSKGTLNLKVLDNHISGQGRYLPTHQKSLGNGLRLDVSAGHIKLENVERNYFASNRRAGFFTQGTISGVIKDNFFFQHFRRALALTDISLEASGQKLMIVGNVIDGATGYGIQVNTGKADVSILNNNVTSVYHLDGVRGNPLLEADGLNLGNMSGSPVLIDGNRFAHSERAGFFLSKSTTKMGQNSYVACGDNIMQKTQAGKDLEKGAVPARAEMQSRKNFDEK